MINSKRKHSETDKVDNNPIQTSQEETDCAVQHKGISAADISICASVLSAFDDKNSFLSVKSSEYAILRPLVYRLFTLDKKYKAERRRDRRQEFKTNDQKKKSLTVLRSSRAKALKHLQLQNILVPDGVVVETKDSPTPELFKQVLNLPIMCYICKVKYNTLHFFYDRLCPTCADFNYQKRSQTVDMSNKIALVTGGRIKIGYRVVLKLLRSNCFVISTTRFPVDFVRRLKAETDYDQWKLNIHVYGVDFRFIDVVENFCQLLLDKYDKLDIIINNACQTVRRPAPFYAHLIAHERVNYALLSSDEHYILGNNNEFWQHQSIAYSSRQNQQLAITASHEDEGTLTSLCCESTQINHVPVSPTSVVRDFPLAAYDVNQQQIDLRTQNSWTMKLGDLSTVEINEVLTINTLVPFILNSRLKSLMSKRQDDMKFIINVSAMEGSFSRRNKTDKHPHTNAAKAALNMMTRTSANDYVKSNIYMVSVDTGWINSENPVHMAMRIMQKQDFQTPLDEEDGASRILDPIVTAFHNIANGVTELNIPYGYFLKDYKKCQW
ncbi:unnamed protein product [Didymodactylos carnosus]|uniref:Oxidoreductase n=1 Tax=Didymodactylos carnosus TaxID=1234261 RepID=A0A814TUN1_9BILA|nr:unnamed protein product [Didymodactylos carnosus]CAF1200645.1 unnamed protein product [Didymodactylos carnosus]CAF3928402.1 unnamed protein product [Didymodactylos carnosus]CAF4010628.1 unnamed protein product [Didymodactylos carnosus]